MSPHKPRMGELSPNMEDYLETIYLQDQDGHPAKVKSIAEAMGVSKPSVTEALSVLKDRGLVLHQKYGDVELTEKGRDAARDIYYRHKLFLTFLRDVLSVDEDIAEDDACKIEHLVSDDTVNKVAALLKVIAAKAVDGGPYSGMLDDLDVEYQKLINPGSDNGGSYS